MHGGLRLLPALALAAVVAGPRYARAESMDPALARLVTDAGCRTTGAGGGAFYNPLSQFARCAPDNAAFAKLVGQYAFAIAPMGMQSAATPGFGGFELLLTGAYTSVDTKAAYTQLGTQGTYDEETGRYPTRNRAPASVLQHYELRLRKGLPFGFEVGASVGMVPHTSMYTFGGEVRLSLLEGFRSGLPAYFPELAVGVAARTVAGADSFKLTVIAVDGQISKPIPIAGIFRLTPYVGYQWLRIFGDSGLVDFTPNTDALNLCGFNGTNTPANPDSSKTYRDGQPICSRGTGADFNNTMSFSPVRMNRHRIDAGLQLKAGFFKGGLHFATDLISPESANSDAGSFIANPNYNTKAPVADEPKLINKFTGMSTQYTLAIELGASF